MANHWMVTSDSPYNSRFPARAVQKPTKRKQEHTTIEPSYVESCLLHLCRGQRWAEVVYRCKNYPDEARLVPIPNDIPNNNNLFYRHSTKRAVIKPIDGEDDRATVFRDSALGIVCSSQDIGSDGAKCAILALINTNPEQVTASQYISGHTPLRDAILNDSCTTEVFSIMTEVASTFTGGNHALQMKDRNGLSPIDHLVTLVHLGSSSHSIDMMEAFLRAKSETIQCIEDHTSPLIRLLTMGNSFNNSQSNSSKTSRVYQSQQQTSNNSDASRSQRVLRATKLLLDDDPTLLFQCSRITECTPLHVALRNYGNYEPLIRELLKRDPCNEMIRVRNLYGDLPIHVACSVGVPLQILHLIVKRTACVSSIDGMQEGIHRQYSGADRDPLIWSANESGYTPVDLEWVRHIESGHGFYNARPFYPLEATGVRKHCFKQDEYYRELLKESVDQVMENYNPDHQEDESESDNREEEAEAIFGCLLDRISLVIRAAATSGFILDSKGAVPAKLVESCTLGTPYSPTLPLPILELFLWLRPEEVLEKDQRDMLPIHHALRYSKTLSCNTCTPSSSNAVDDWRSFVFQLLQKSPEQCKAKCKDGRLPLHYVLDHSSNYDGNEPRIASMENLQYSRHAIVEELVEIYPESVDQRDPITGLYPFMIASMDRNLSVDTVFCLLRHSPSRCPDLLSTVTTVTT
eukprot:jgi/Psemu1/294196/fgenesh1_pm.11_\